MTKQEEIREGVARAISECPIGNVGCDGLAQHIINYLHSQGVVIKVERELPYNSFSQYPTIDNPLGTGKLHISEIYPEAQQEMLQAGYVATEPLIEK